MMAGPACPANAVLPTVGDSGNQTLRSLLLRSSAASASVASAVSTVCMTREYFARAMAPRATQAEVRQRAKEASPEARVEGTASDGPGTRGETVRLSVRLKAARKRALPLQSTKAELMVG